MNSSFKMKCPHLRHFCWSKLVEISQYLGGGKGAYGKCWDL